MRYSKKSSIISVFILCAASTGLNLVDPVPIPLELGSIAVPGTKFRSEGILPSGPALGGAYPYYMSKEIVKFLTMNGHPMEDRGLLGEKLKNVAIPCERRGHPTVNNIPEQCLLGKVQITQALEKSLGSSTVSIDLINV